jgi:hypothetical protein
VVKRLAATCENQTIGANSEIDLRTLVLVLADMKGGLVLGSR